MYMIFLWLPILTYFRNFALYKFLKSANFVSFTDKNFKCLTEIKILSVRMSDIKFKMFYTE